jgi:hypothetical protein
MLNKHGLLQTSALLQVLTGNQSIIFGSGVVGHGRIPIKPPILDIALLVVGQLLGMSVMLIVLLV